MTIGRIGSEFLVNSTTTGIQSDSALATLADGRIVATWRDLSTTGSDATLSAMRARIFSANGSEITPEFLVNTTTAGSQRDGSITSLSDGRFMVTWEDTSATAGDTSSSAIRARIFNADGTQSVPEFVVNTSTFNSQFDSNVVELADGRILVSWTDVSQTGADPSLGAIRASIFNADGTQSVAEFVVNSTVVGDQNESAIAALSDGRFVVSWTDVSTSGGDTSGNAVRARIFNADGSQSISEFLVNSTTTNGQSQSKIAVLPDDRFIITWTDASATGGDISLNAIRARIFNADGTQATAEFVVNTTVADRQIESSVAVLADGRFVVAWSDLSLSASDPSNAAIRARIFNSDGTESIPEFLVNTTTLSDQFDSSITTLEDGRFMISWTDNSGTGVDSSSGGIGSQIFDPKIFDGTSAGETVTGGAFADNYSGYGGSDTISGRGGDDYLNGGDGDDTLNGDDGNDRLDGGASGDTLNGGAGSDFIYGRAGTDILSGGDGGDHLWGGLGVDIHNGGGGTGTDYARYDDANYGNLTIRLDNAALNAGAAAVGDTYNGIEGLVGGQGADTVVGDAQANFLFGGGAADQIFGGDGADFLSGDAGGDNLWGGLGADQHVGGNDTGLDFARYDDANYGNLTIRLDAPAFNAGAAAVGDTYSGIEGLVGGAGADVIIGNSGGNFLFGQGNSDFIDGLDGSDSLNGGAGADRFRFSTALGATNVDKMVDFVHLTDDIVLSTAIFAAVGPALTADELRFGSAAGDANDFIIYNQATGQIFYDANGSAAGGAGQVLFATVTAGTVLIIDDFLVA